MVQQLRKLFQNRIYSDWERSRLAIHTSHVMVFVLLLHIIGGAIEFMVYDRDLAVRHATERILAVSLILLLFGLSQVLRIAYPRKKMFANDMILAAVALSTELVYVIFMLGMKDNGNVLAITGGMIVLFSFLLSTFRAAFFTYFITSSISIALLAILIDTPDFLPKCRILAQVHVASFISILFTSTLKHIELIEMRYEQLRSVSNDSVARLAVIRDQSLNEIQELRARKRPLAVLIADWRGFQQLAESLPAEKVAFIMKSFYNKSYEIQRDLGLDDAYLNWIGGDTLVGTFYSGKDQKEEIIHAALVYTRELAKVMGDHVEAETGFRVAFDIGLAYGEDSIFGLLGPSHDVKMSVAGALPGRASRYEAEAKAVQRSRSLQVVGGGQSADTAPVIVCDPIFASLGQHMQIPCRVTKIVATGKDVAGVGLDRIEFDRAG